MGSERLTNVGLAVIVGLAVGSGLVANAIGPQGWLHPSVIHGVVGLSVVLLVPWKTPIARRGLRRRRSARWLSLLLAVLTLVTVASGLVHATGVARIGPLTVMQVHVGAAVGVAVAVVVHMRTRPVKVRLPDVDRRTVLAGLALTAGAVAVRSTWEAGLDAGGASGADRRFTGSHERGSYDQRAMPVTQWLDDAVPSLDRSDHRLTVDGTPWTVEGLASIGAEVVEATIDCTGGWFATQRWDVVPLAAIVDAGDALSLEARSTTGYARRFPVRDIDRLYLAVGIDGEPLTPGHGHPVRLVAPGRRGFWWVKWVTSIETSRRPWWLQSPFPLT